VIFKSRRDSYGGKKRRAKKVGAQGGQKTKRGEEIDTTQIRFAKVGAEGDVAAKDQREKISSTKACREEVVAPRFGRQEIIASRSDCEEGSWSESWRAKGRGAESHRQKIGWGRNDET
jgi:hypothetical protein